MCSCNESFFNPPQLALRVRWPLDNDLTAFTRYRYESVTLPRPGNVDTEVEPTLPGADATFAAARLEHMVMISYLINL